MPGYFLCTVEAIPCPPEAQQQVVEITLELLAAMGITSASLLKATAFGFGAVLTPVAIAIAVSAIVRTASRL